MASDFRHKTEYLYDPSALKRIGSGSLFDSIERLQGWKSAFVCGGVTKCRNAMS